jgi:hypothetical protein
MNNDLTIRSSVPGEKIKIVNSMAAKYDPKKQTDFFN